MLGFASSTVLQYKAEDEQAVHSNSSETLWHSALLKWIPRLVLMPGHRTCSGHDRVLKMTLYFVGFRLTDQELSHVTSRQKVRELTRNFFSTKQ